MEYCPDGSLQHKLKANKKSKTFFSEKDTMRIINCLIRGIAGLASKGIWHRDIKPDNILIKEDKFKICDYGFTKIVSCNPGSVKDFTKVGTPLYCCP
jgi:calcium-dependent protein kinase